MIFPIIESLTEKHKSKGENAIYENDDRAIKLAQYLTENNATVRKAALVFGISKSTVHKDVTGRLKYIDRPLYERIIRLFEINKSERHLRGGMATKMKYMNLKGNAENNS